MKIRHIAENAVVLSVSYGTTAECVAEIRRIYNSLQRCQLPGLISIRPGLDCLMLEFESPVNVDSIILEGEAVKQEPRSISVPVCYELGTDLDDVCSRTNLSREQLIELHMSRTYSVWMIGFMPGYPYMGELPQQVQLPRKTKPAQNVPAGSVAIADEFVGIYPFDSPGGWHVIGRTPLKLIDYSRENPSLFQYGMNVQFYRISEREFIGATR